MNKYLILIVLFFPLMAWAQQEVNIQHNKTAQCMQSINQDAIKALEKETKTFDAEMEKLCRFGNEYEAKKKNKQFRKKMFSNSTFKTINKCMKDLPEQMKGMVPNTGIKADTIIKKYNTKNACDGIKKSS